MEEEVVTVDDISSKTWDNMENKLMKEGLREGAGAGREQVFQPSFDDGYKEGFRMGYNKGFLKGFLSVLNEEELEGSDTETNLRQPPCTLCEDDIHEKIEGQKLSEIVNTLKKDDEVHVSLLRNKYSNFLQKIGIDSQSISSASSRK